VSIEWSGLGPELLLRLDRSRPEPLRVQLERELRDAIRTGRLAAGERLPSSRELARELGVSRGLVQECYRQLQAEGFLSAHGGSATRVAAGAYDASDTLSQAPPPPAPRLSVDFRPGLPDLTSFPRTDWAWAVREVLRTAPDAALGYGDPRGSERLREVVAAYLRRVRGAAAAPEQIVVAAGFAQGINLILRAIALDGVRVVGVEDPGDPDQGVAAERAGMDAVPIPVDADGIDVDALARSGARAVVLTPTHQTPTGGVLAPARRRALLRWAEERDATIVEDDYDSEFRYDRDPVGALQGLAPDHVATLGSVSKSLAPALRLGWVVCPPRLAEAVAEAKRVADRGSPTLDQLALARLIESGRYDRHLRRMRASYARRRDTLVAALTRHAPGVELTGLAAGFHAVAHLPDGADEQPVVEAARRRGIGLHGMSGFRFDRATTPPQLVLGFGNVREEAIERGVATVADLLRGG
jgi:GntR family transcriptional regulator/MocR family aminotransferase